MQKEMDIDRMSKRYLPKGDKVRWSEFYFSFYDNHGDQKIQITDPPSKESFGASPLKESYRKMMNVDEEDPDSTSPGS